jgi:hypothetical protein
MDIYGKSKLFNIIYRAKKLKGYRMKLDAYTIISETVDQDTLAIDTVAGPQDIKVDKRPTSLLTDEVVKDASKVASDSTAKVKDDPDPKKMKSDKEKGTAAGTGK